MPVTRQKYDITRADFAEIAESAADAVVSELKARAEQLVPRQADEIRQIADWLSQSIVQAVTAAIEPQLRQLALSNGGGASLGGSGVAVEAGLAQVHELLGEVLSQWRTVEASRRAGLDRLDEVLVDLRSGLAENVTRQHAVLLEIFDNKLNDLRLTELADDLPGRIGAVISEAIERSHAMATADVATLKQELSVALDAGLERHRAAIIELAAVGERLTGLADQVSETVERVVAAAFERAQGAQMQRLSVMVTDLRTQQEESIEQAMTRLETALTVGLERQEALLDKLTSEVEGVLRDGLHQQEQALVHIREAEQRVLDLVDTVPGRVAETLAESLKESASRATRVENLLAELAWSLGEMRAGNDGLRTELARVAAELPESAAALHDAAGRSEARLVDLIARVAGNGAA